MSIFFKSLFKFPSDFPKACCKCKLRGYNTGRCYISVAPPKGYMCECTLDYVPEADYEYCYGENYKCVVPLYPDQDNPDEFECRGCTEKDCCRGNCEGY